MRVAPKEQAQLLRKETGRWLRELREKRGLSQRELAEKVGAEVYTLISQLEHGRGRIPPVRYLVWAEALQIEPSELARRFHVGSGLTTSFSEISPWPKRLKVLFSAALATWLLSEANPIL